MEVNKKLFKRNLTYEQWLKDFVKPLSSELNQMEELSNSNSVNNSNFHPLKGA